MHASVDIHDFDHMNIVVSEALTGLGFPRTRYSSQTYNCSEGDFGLIELWLTSITSLSIHTR